jgi:thiamine-monophosphate kinase
MSKTLADVGEFGLIDRIHKLLKKEGTLEAGVTVGIGDDTAAFLPRAGYELLATCDCLVEGRHFMLERTHPLNLGRRAMVANISDIGAMGGRPLYALVSLGLKTDMTVSSVVELYRGFLRELNPFGASIIGGNITKTTGALFIYITLIGEVEKDKIILRSGAKPGDALLVTGYPGQAAAGLELLKRFPSEKGIQNHPLVLSYNTPSHRAREGKAIASTGWANAMIDTSDGFLGDLGHICKTSGVGALLFQEKLPISADLAEAAKQLNLDPHEIFLQDSDDYELIFTCPQDKAEKVCSAIAAVSDVPVAAIGEITEEAGAIKLILTDGTRQSLSPSGWDHFVK